MTFRSPLHASAVLLSLFLAAPLPGAAQEAAAAASVAKKALPVVGASAMKASEIARSGGQKPIGALAAPGDQIVLSSRTYCFDANDNVVTCPDKIMIRKD